MSKTQLLTDEEIELVVKEFVRQNKEKGNENEMMLFRKWINELKKQQTHVTIDGISVQIPSYTTVFNRFGSWFAILERIGAEQPTFMETKRVLKTYELPEIREHFLKCKAFGDGTFTPRKYQTYAREHQEAPRFRQILFQYDNWDNLLQKLNEKYPEDLWLSHSLENVEKIPQKSKGKRPEHWKQLSSLEQKFEMMKTLLAVSEENHGDLSPKIYIRAEAYPNVSTVIRKFGTWENAVRSTQQWFHQSQIEERTKVYMENKTKEEQPQEWVQQRAKDVHYI